MTGAVLDSVTWILEDAVQWRMLGDGSKSLSDDSSAMATFFSDTQRICLQETKWTYT